MRSTLLVLTIALAACDSEPQPVDFGTPDLATKDFSLNCASSCPACATGTTCVTSSGGVDFFSATCLASCQTDDDCGTRFCVALDDASPSGRYCLAIDEPTSCGIDCDLVPPYGACDGNLAVTLYHGVACGRRYHLCPNGCVEDAPDGGDDHQPRCL